MSHELSLRDAQKQWHGSLRSYIIGFLTSLLLTAVSFALCLYKPFSEMTTIYTIVSLALIQAVVQLLYFLHLGQEDRPKWETGVFFMMLLLLLIIAIGSLWVMNDLNERMMIDMPMEMRK